MIRKLADEISLKARQMVTGRFAWETSIARLEQTLNRCIPVRSSKAEL